MEYAHAVVTLGPNYLLTRAARSVQTEVLQMGIPANVDMALRVEDMPDGTSLFFLALLGERETILIIAETVRDKILRSQG